jgi:hypothetical protein
MGAEGEIIRQTLFYSGPGASECQNVFYWKIEDAASDSANKTDLNLWIAEEWGPAWADFASDAYEIIGVSYDVVNLDGTVARSLGGTVLSIPGTEASTVNPGGVTPVIFANTVRPKTRGRKFLPGINQASVPGGFIDAATLAEMAILLLKYVALYEGAGTGTYGPGVISTVLGVGFLRFLQAGGFDDIPDYLLRRRPDRGS